MSWRRLCGGRSRRARYTPAATAVTDRPSSAASPPSLTPVLVRKGVQDDRGTCLVAGHRAPAARRGRQPPAHRRPQQRPGLRGSGWVLAGTVDQRVRVGDQRQVDAVLAISPTACSQSTTACVLGPSSARAGPGGTQASQTAACGDEDPRTAQAAGG